MKHIKLSISLSRSSFIKVSQTWHKAKSLGTQEESDSVAKIPYPSLLTIKPVKISW